MSYRNEYELWMNIEKDYDRFVDAMQKWHVVCCAMRVEQFPAISFKGF